MKASSWHRSLQIWLILCSTSCSTTTTTVGFLLPSSKGGSGPLRIRVHEHSFLPIDSHVRRHERRKYHKLRFYFAQGDDDDDDTVSSLGTTITTTTTTRRRPRRTTKRRRKPRFDDMIDRLQAYYEEKGHSLVTKDHPDKELYQWTLSVRHNYKHQALQWSSTRNKRRKEDSVGDSTTKTRNTTAVGTAAAAAAATNGPQLSRDKFQQLQDLEFPWDLQAAKWNQRYRDLRAYHDRHGHCRVPANFAGGLGIWVRNQRREYQRLQRGESSTLYPERLKALQALGFEWYKSRETMWDKRYRELVAFSKEHGHSNVPEDYADNFSLGQWCMNQRTAYRQYCRNEPTAMTQVRVEKLEALGFVWDYRQQQWNDMRERLKRYYDQNGHVKIAATDQENSDLRVWLNFQRFLFNRRRAGFKTPLTKKRIKALEEDIPNFSWRGREGISGPKAEDWAKLFEAMRDRGIAPGARPKQHWFEGINPFTIQVKDTYTEQDLLELWNQQDDDDDDDDETLNEM